MRNCPTCGNPLTPDQQKLSSPSKQKILHSHDNKIFEDTVVASTTEFFEVITGPRKGGLVHRWSIIKYLTK